MELGFENGIVDDIFFVPGYDLLGFVVAQVKPCVKNFFTVAAFYIYLKKLCCQQQRPNLILNHSESATWILLNLSVRSCTKSAPILRDFKYFDATSIDVSLGSSLSLLPPTNDNLSRL